LCRLATLLHDVRKNLPINCSKLMPFVRWCPVRVRFLDANLGLHEFPADL
jgi:hypothetical protein